MHFLKKALKMCSCFYLYFNIITSYCSVLTLVVHVISFVIMNKNSKYDKVAVEIIVQLRDDNLR